MLRDVGHSGADDVQLRGCYEFDVKLVDVVFRAIDHLACEPPFPVELIQR